MLRSPITDAFDDLERFGRLFQCTSPPAILEMTKLVEKLTTPKPGSTPLNAATIAAMLKGHHVD